MNGNWNSDNRCFNSRAHGGRDGATGPWPDSGGCFNSRAHGGRDKTPLDIWHLGQVSIHAPTGGATGRRTTTAVTAGVSIHAPTGGATTSACAPSSASTAFQFTRPRGARQGRGFEACDSTCFNSRAHGGRDRLGKDAGDARGVSIHAPTGGATFGGGRGRLVDGVSIHAPTGGATAAGV